MPRHFWVRVGLSAAAVVGAVAVAAHAQIAAPSGSPSLPGFCTGGPFTLTGGEVKFHVALDDHHLASPMSVTMRLYDAAGTVVARRSMLLTAGATATLEFRGAGLLRPQATFESLLDAGDRRDTVGSVEVHDVGAFRAVIPVTCVPNENIGR